MIECTVSTSFLMKAWFVLKKQDIPPRLTISEGKVKVVAFPRGGAGMRVSYYPISEKISTETTFEVSDALRCFIKKISLFGDVKMTLENNGLTISAESPTVAIQYIFPTLKILEDNYIDNHEDDQTLSVSTADWFNMWNTMPPKGSVTISISKKSKVITLNHSRGHWKSAVIGRSKPSRDASIVVDSGIAKSVFVDPKQSVFSEVIFKHVGVLHWRSKDEEIYVAPVE